MFVSVITMAPIINGIKNRKKQRTRYPQLLCFQFQSSDRVHGYKGTFVVFRNVFGCELWRRCHNQVLYNLQECDNKVTTAKSDTKINKIY